MTTEQNDCVRVAVGLGYVRLLIQPEQLFMVRESASLAHFN